MNIYWIRLDFFFLTFLLERAIIAISFFNPTLCHQLRVWCSGWMPMSPLRPRSRVWLVVIPTITHWALLFAKTHQKKNHNKKKNIFWTTWLLDPSRGYIGNIISFAEFSHALKKFIKKKTTKKNRPKEIIKKKIIKKKFVELRDDLIPL